MYEILIAKGFLLLDYSFAFIYNYIKMVYSLKSSSQRKIFLAILKKNSIKKLQKRKRKQIPMCLVT